MIFTETAIKGVFVLDLQRREDERGFFARVFCRREFEEHGLEPAIAQANTAFSRLAGTVRGMHFQFPPDSEAKLVRCTRGSILDVVVDLRPESPTYLRHLSLELNEENGRSLYVPRRFAHGYQVLRDDSEATYSASEFYSPALESGIRYDDPRLAIEWPMPITSVSDKDRSWPLLDLREQEFSSRMRPDSSAPVSR